VRQCTANVIHALATSDVHVVTAVHCGYNTTAAEHCSVYEGVMLNALCKHIVCMYVLML
jgi:hypothetical protein